MKPDIDQFTVRDSRSIVTHKEAKGAILNQKSKVESKIKAGHQQLFVYRKVKGST
jgi:hypothetical protein